MSILKIQTLFLSLLLLLSLSACAEKPSANEPGADLWQGVELYKAENKTDEALLARYEEYRENSSLAFKDYSPVTAASFETEALEEGIKLTKYVGTERIVVIPEKIGEVSVTAIGGDCFKDSTVGAVYLPDTVKTIEKGAFAGCLNLSTIRLPFIGDGKGADHFGVIFGADSYENHALAVPVKLDMVIFGNLAEIPDNAFAGCKTLSAVILPNSLKKIGDFSFYECRDLVYFATESVKFDVGSYAFGGCSSLFAMEIADADEIGEGAFFECNSLEELTLPFVGESREENGFIGWLFGGESADHNQNYVPKSLRRVTLNQNCTAVPDKAFYHCRELDEIILEEGITKIGVRAFYACRSLVALEFPDTLTEIADDGFFGCDNLKTVTFGKNLKKIGMQAFYGCVSLEPVNTDGIELGQGNEAILPPASDTTEESQT